MRGFHSYVYTKLPEGVSEINPHVLMLKNTMFCMNPGIQWPESDSRSEVEVIFPLFRSAFEVNKRSFEQVRRETWKLARS